MQHMSLQEAASILGVTTKTFRSYVRRGLIRPSYPEGKKLNAPEVFDEASITAFLEVKDKKMDLAEVAALANQAYVINRRLELKLDTILFMLGVDIPDIPYTEEATKELYATLEEALAEPIEPTLQRVIELSRTLFAIDEEVLRMIEETMEDFSPWVKPLALAGKLFSEMLSGDVNTDPSRRLAYNYIKIARRTLKATCYFYILNYRGKKAAQQEMPAMTDDHEAILNFAFLR